MLESLGNAIGTLVDRNTDAAKVDVWERNLKGFSGQYYGRLAVSLVGCLATCLGQMLKPRTARPVKTR